MNERIKLLALEAKFGAAILLHHYGTVDYLCDSEQEELEQIEKFAELIVRECVDIACKHMELNEGTDYNIGEQIKQHFGVEE